MQVGRHEHIRPIPWEGGKAEARLLDRLGLAEAARAAAAQAASEHDQVLARRAARRTSSSDAGVVSPHLVPSLMPVLA